MASGPSTDRPEPDVRAAALAAAARTRAQGMHYYGHVLGVTPLRTDAGPSRPHLAVSSAVPPGPVPPVALATVADLAMGSALRSVVGAGRRLGTVSMTLHHLAPVVCAPVVPDPRVVWLDDEQVNGLARVDLTDAAGALVGAAQGWFMALPVPLGTPLPLLPWERDELPAVAPLAEHDLTAAERAAVEATVRAAERARRHRTSASAELTAPTWTDAAEGSARGTLRIGRRSPTGSATCRAARSTASPSRPPRARSAPAWRSPRGTCSSSGRPTRTSSRQWRRRPGSAGARRSPRPR